ncbi:MAG: sortase B protein-sorting domain-containing protein [Firmicutes bacterium]|nr:sortase B protein-sorting domain-containing protein [Bacillota bacterium]
MMKAMKKTLAFLLALVLIGTSGVFSTLHVSAAENNKEAKEPQVVSKTDTSITLQTQENLEYALQVKDEKTDTLIWKWATDDQYNLEKQTVIFQDLKADTDYKFTYREKNSQEETELPVFTIRTDVQKEQENITTPDNTKPQENNTTPDKTKPQEDNTAPDNTKPQGETPPSTDNTNKLQMATPPSDSHVDSPTDEKPEGINTPPMDIQPPKDTTPKPVNAPDAPTAASVTDTEIILNTEEKQEYAMIQDEKDLVWQASGIFKDLKPSTDYSFVTRIKTDTEISENSKPLKVITKSSAAKAPATPELSEKTDTRIQIHSVTGQEYSLLKDGKPISWNTSGNFENLSPETEYQIVTRIIFNDEDAMPSEISKPLIITTKSIAAQAPEAPKLSGRSETSITLQAQKSLEYAISTDGTTWKWQSGNVFSGLKENTSYQFIARKAFDSDKAMPSKESPAITYQTYMAFQGTIEGIKANGTYYRDTKLTATAVGTGMNQTSPGNWDSRWVPKTWTWDGKNYSSWKSAPYDVTFVLDKVGDYCLTVGYELEEHTSGSWKGTGLTKTSSVSFKAVVPVYTIQASSDKYGKISPSGTIEVKEGSSTEFTFTPNKDYKVSKVFVNGKQVTIKNNKYTISNVKANQTISVSFERIDGRQIPKTGDESQIFLYTVLFVSATAIFLLVIRAQRKKNHN